ncbi:LPS translocon maturation chaperone LptM [Acidithiobacillus sulfurivorans]|uniref:Sugar transporter n=1 Tax=Acidithiobacillus sulfurivorans TaxID=1958756 RepID=A0ABS5ZZS0_9PROT|nr:lipoprotein [Acidithiobacillus sulfurivorans]MBU2760588.1 sugar transporter [Acidithiobacillus sulfurivorans]
MKPMAAVAFSCLLVLGLAGCGRKTPLSLPPPPPAHPAVNAAVAPAPISPTSSATGSAARP